MSHRTLLAVYLADQKLTAGEFAKRVNADRSQIYRCASGKRGPSVELAIAIEKATKGAVPVEAWAPPAAKKSRRSAAA